MFKRLGNFVSRHWLITILFWVVLVVVVRLTSPKWDSVTHDGDLAYMPTSMPSVQGELLLEQAFPRGRSKSEAVVVFARKDRTIDIDDLRFVRRLVIRFQNMLGTAAFERSLELQSKAAALRDQQKLTEADRVEALVTEQRTVALEALEQAVDLDEELDVDQQNAAVHHNLAILYAADGSAAEVRQLRATAWALEPALEATPNQLADSGGNRPLIGVWSRYSDWNGSELVSKDKKSDLIILRLSEEFMAAGNIPFLEEIEEILEATRSSSPQWPEGLALGLSGSAAVGSDMLRSAAESIDNTEVYTVLLVVLILFVVYRSPFLIAVPLVSIVVSLVVATGLVAQLTTLDQLPGMDWWSFKIFTTTKIFVIVILFGAGTDYCLFLIARYKEELDAGKDKTHALACSLGGVGSALAASALTTILGLGMMYWADFGKFRNSGPAIGLCLLITLFACITLAPALLGAMGSAVHWPFRRRQTHAVASLSSSKFNRVWQRLADLIMARPATVLLSCTAVMFPFFLLGFDVEITYDLLSELDPRRASRQGAALLRRHFPIGESGPLVVLAQKPGADLDSEDGIVAIRQLTSQLYLDGVRAVRSLISPKGKPPSKRPSGRDLLAQNHRITRELFLSKEPSLEGDVARFELVLDHDPFSLEATEVLQRVDTSLAKLSGDKSSYWSGSRFVFAGTTAAIRDLREVTRSDNTRIQVLVVLAVLMILLILLKRPAVCIYLILSVLFSYYVTIGATELFFRWRYGETFEGLDWKVPLFLFVILVAIGQDYNIYLATRVFEEQRQHGLFGGLRHAIVRTGGIITSCGVIMAGTFFSMMSGSIRGIVELGFALTLGVLLDTFVVRPILVPAFLAILFRWHARKVGGLAADGRG